jgi:transposase
MSVRPRLGVEVPELTARMARASNPAGTTAMWVRDRLDGLWTDEDFAEWYPRDGRPGISPAQLATVSVLQFLLGLSDRDAAEAVRCRIDFKYALGLDLDDPGFHHSVLGDFRERLLEDGRADRLLDLALARLKEAGLVRERTTQRTRPGGRAGPDPPGAGHRGGPRRPGGAGPHRPRGTGRPRR